MIKKSLIIFGATVFAVATPTVFAAGTGSSKSTTSMESPTSDARMAQEVRDSLSKDASLSSKAKSLRVSSANGNVTVTGTVASEAEKSRVESMARSAAGEKVIMDVAVE